ncbi:MAG: ABC transporter permease [Treponema sp.]|nr:ABC transporter permease [Treponema sp.]
MCTMKNISFNFLVGSTLIFIVFFLAFVSFFYTPYSISAMDDLARNLPPSRLHIAGTDAFGRDIFSRLMVGARFTLIVALATVAVSTVVGSVIGLVSGYVGGAADEIIMRFADVFSSFPGILMALVIVTVMNYGQYTIVIALCVMFVPSYVRIVRVGTLQCKKSEFVQNYRVYGASHLRLIAVHIYPNVFPLMFPSIIVGISNAILAESSMSYLGLGIQPPVPSWGWMMNEAQNSIFTAPWYAVCTGLMIVLTIIGFNCLGEGLEKSYGK